MLTKVKFPISDASPQNVLNRRDDKKQLKKSLSFLQAKPTSCLCKVILFTKRYV